MREADVAAAVSDLAAYYLENAGVEVMQLQSDNLYHDSDHDLPCVVDQANGWPADLFVSVHCNAAGSDAAGTETLVYSDDGGASSKLAACIQNQIVSSLGTTDRGIKQRRGLIVLNSTDMPAVLVELAFISNSGDAALLANNQDDFARAIARGVTDYIQSNCNIN